MLRRIAFCFFLIFSARSSFAQEAFHVTPFGEKFGFNTKFWEVTQLEKQGDKVYAINPWELIIFSSAKIFYKSNPFPIELIPGTDRKMIPKLRSFLLSRSRITLISRNDKIAISTDQGKTWTFSVSGEEHKDALTILGNEQTVVPLNDLQQKDAETLCKTKIKRIKKNKIIDSEAFLSLKKGKGLVLQKEGEGALITQDISGKAPQLLGDQFLVWTTPKGKVETFDLKEQKLKKINKLNDLNGIRTFAKCSISGKMCFLDGHRVFSFNPDGNLDWKEIHSKEKSDEDAISKVRDAALEGEDLYGIGSRGSLFSIGTKNGDLSRIKVDGNMISGMVFYKSKLVCWTNEDIYVVERNKDKK